MKNNQGDRIALIGARRAGKSKISRKLARKSGRVNLSTDNLICYEAGGMPVEKIVSLYGWTDFRNREYEILKKIIAMDSVILDCGGGILFEAPHTADGEETFSSRKAELLENHSTVVYIQRSIDWLLKNSQKDSSRPDLPGSSYEKLLEKRIPFYEQAADITVDMSRFTIDGAVDYLTETFGSARV